MAKARKAKAGFVYIMANQHGSIFKYGASIDPIQRARTISSGCPGDVFSVVKQYRTKDMFKEENKLKWALITGLVAVGTEFVYQELMELKDLIALTEKTIEVY
jgi:hypothetical protein